MRHARIASVALGLLLSIWTPTVAATPIGDYFGTNVQPLVKL